MAASSSSTRKSTVVMTRQKMKNRKGTIKTKTTKTHFKDRKNGNRKLKQLMKTKFKVYKRKKRVRQYNSDEESEEVILSDPEECMEPETTVTNDDEDVEETRGSRNVSSLEEKDSAPEEEGGSNDDDDDDETGGKRSKGNEGWADVMTKILARQLDSKRPAILAKGRTDQEIARKKKELEKGKEQGFEIDGGEANLVTEDAAKTSYERGKSVKQMKRELQAKQLEKKTWENMGRTKPDVLNREKERALQRIATRGVVQLFNAVRERQKTVAVKLNEVGGSEVKRERVMKSMTKGDFLDVLKQRAKSIPLKDAVNLEKKEATKAETSTKPTWNVFSEKFMLDAKMKDWDKDSDSNSDIWENNETLVKNENDDSPSCSGEG